MNIYVGNLSSSSTEKDVQGEFERFGKVSSVKIIVDFDSGYSKGFGFVTMDDANEAGQAITGLNGSQMNGNSLTVNEARPRTEGGGGGGSSYKGGNGSYGNSRGGSGGGGGKKW